MGEGESQPAQRAGQTKREKEGRSRAREISNVKSDWSFDNDLQFATL
jgi:hypothetical protein